MKLFDSSIDAVPDQAIKRSLKAFLDQPEDYRMKFLQSSYDKGFDGYSYLGQKDSTNQYDSDILHSFVLSEFSEVSSFPLEFHDFLNEDWEGIVDKVKDIELQTIEKLNIPELKEFYTNHMGHMITCNYYPTTAEVETSPKTKLRLSNHKDVSLFSVFIFGLKEGLSYDRNGITEKLGTKTSVILFPGYLLEYITEGKIKAVSHEVELPQFDEERYSFAFFSIPKPSAKINFNNINSDSESYYKAYLSLF